jgi:hypothetical protein
MGHTVPDADPYPKAPKGACLWAAITKYLDRWWVVKGQYVSGMR